MSHSDPDLSHYLEVLGFSPQAWGKTATAPLRGEADFKVASAPSSNDSDTSGPQAFFGQGPATADLMFVGEAPDALEEVQAQILRGPAGELLAKMIGAMGLRVEDVYIGYLVPGNGPASEERERLEKVLRTKIENINPRIVVTLGTLSTQTLLRSEDSLNQLRGQWQSQDSWKRSDGSLIAILPTLAPAYLLREASMKKVAWDDLQQVMRRLKA